MGNKIQTTNKILGLSGSLRKNSFNSRLLRIASTVSPSNLKFQVFEDLRTIPLFNEDLEGGPNGDPKGVINLRKECFKADGLIFATPEYNQSMSGVMKNLVDWLSRGGNESVLKEKPVAILGVTVGPWGTRLAQAALRQTLTATESLVMPSPSLFFKFGHDLFSKEGGAKKELTPILGHFLNQFNQWITLFKQRR